MPRQPRRERSITNLIESKVKRQVVDPLKGSLDGVQKEIQQEVAEPLQSVSHAHHGWGLANKLSVGTFILFAILFVIWACVHHSVVGWGVIPDYVYKPESPQVQQMFALKDFEGWKPQGLKGDSKTMTSLRLKDLRWEPKKVPQKGFDEDMNSDSPADPAVVKDHSAAASPYSRYKFN